ncbi:uncharacterized protein LOC116971201 [Amblyraja radiata]|uniref:uncharacterized protein LOC116971201 n=1 Tax=Amblyraja radiata TaxID=386614 RepID=UPI0014026AB2|nr:uncharacterized protein LOC116971201 [Amblyraja radiata]
MRMACLTFSYKVLIVGVILAVLTDGESTPKYPSSSGVNSTSTPDPDDFTSHFNSTMEEISTPSPRIVTETASNSNSSYNYTFATTDQYNNGSTSPHGNLSYSLVQERHVSDIPGNTSTTSTTEGDTSTEPHASTGQTSKQQGPPAATTSSTQTSISKESSTWTSHFTSTSQPPPESENSIAPGILIALFILALTIVLLCLIGCYLHRRKHRSSFDLSYKTAEDVNIPLSSPMLSGGFELKPDQENNKGDTKVNNDKNDHDQASVPTHNLSKEINEKQNNCETEINHLPEKADQEGTDVLEDWNFKSAASSFTDINLMDCITKE